MFIRESRINILQFKGTIFGLPISLKDPNVTMKLYFLHNIIYKFLHASFASSFYFLAATEKIPDITYLHLSLSLIPTLKNVR